MKFVILVLGKSKFPFVQEGVEHYVKNANHLGEVEILELKDQSSDPAQEVEKIEATLVRKKWSGDGKTKIFLLDERGAVLTSAKFAETLKKSADQGAQRFIFIVGGAFGFTEAFRKKYTLLSLSAMTFPHDLIRVFLTEQIYRALHILSGGKYHHEG